MVRIPFTKIELSFFNMEDFREIGGNATTTFVKTWGWYPKKPEPPESDNSVESDNLDTELSDSSDDESNILDPYGCDDIGLEAEMTVEDNWEDCHPLESIFGTTGSEIVEGTIRTATEETECVGIKAFSHLIPGEDRDLITTCATVCYWCCCESIKKVSPLIANATINLLD